MANAELVVVPVRLQPLAILVAVRLEALVINVVEDGALSELLQFRSFT